MHACATSITFEFLANFHESQKVMPKDIFYLSFLNVYVHYWNLTINQTSEIVLKLIEPETVCSDYIFGNMELLLKLFW